MAEVFATVASSAGLASLGIQIIEGLVKLRDLCSRIHGAPEAVQQLLSELETLAHVLEEYENTVGARAQGASAASHALKDAVRKCIEVQQNLSEISHSFEKDLFMLSSRRRSAWASVKFAVSEKHVATLLAKIERAKSSVALAIQMDQLLLQKSRFDNVDQSLQQVQKMHHSVLDTHKQLIGDIHQQVSSHLRQEIIWRLDEASVKQLGEHVAHPILCRLGSRINQAHEQNILDIETRMSNKITKSRAGTTSHADISRSKDASTKWHKIELGILTVTVTRVERDSHAELQGAASHSSSTYRIVFAPWFLSRAVAFTVQQSYGRMKRTLETQRLVSADAEIFQICATGDEISLRKLMADGKGSPFDTTHDGVTPLIVST